MTDFPPNFGILFALAFFSFTVKNTPDLVKISGKNIVCVCVCVCVCVRVCVVVFVFA